MRHRPVVIYFAFLLLGTAIAAPFLDVLAQRVEMLNTGRAVQEPAPRQSAVSSFGTLVVQELRKLGFFLGVQLGLFLLGLSPFLSPIMIVLGTLFTMLFLPLEYASFAMDHRQPARAASHPDLAPPLAHAGLWSGCLPHPAHALAELLCLPALVVGGTFLLPAYRSAPPHLLSIARGNYAAVLPAARPQILLLVLFSCMSTKNLTCHRITVERFSLIETLQR